MRRIMFKLVDFDGNVIEERKLTLGASVGTSFSESGYNEKSENTRSHS